MSVNVKDVLKPVPQPYKTWVARAIIPFFFAVFVPIAAVIEGAGWIKDTCDEFIDAWHDVRAW